MIGDVHGAYKCLVDVLEKAGEADRVVFLGDYVDGLPETYEVIEHIMGMKNAVCIRGNHDQWALDWMKSPHLPMQHIHYTQGGRSTRESYSRLLEDLGVSADQWSGSIKKHLEFLENGTIMYFLDEENRLFVHGGIDRRGLDTPDMVKMWDRDLIDEARRWFYSTREVGLPYPKPFSDFREIYVGHTATVFLTGKEEPANWLNLWDMDTNCGWGGPLCAMDVDTKEVFYSAPARELYPGYHSK